MRGNSEGCYANNQTRLIHSPAPISNLRVRTSAQTSLRKVLLQLFHHLLRLRELEFARGPLLNPSPELRTAAVRAQQRHLEAAPSGLGRVHLHWKLGGLQAQRLAQGRGVAPVDASARAMLDNDRHLLHSLAAAGQLLSLLGHCDRRLGLPLPPAGSHGAWSPTGNRADQGREQGGDAATERARSSGQSRAESQTAGQKLRWRNKTSQIGRAHV